MASSRASITSHLISSHPHTQRDKTVWRSLPQFTTGYSQAIRTGKMMACIVCHAIPPRSGPPLPASTTDTDRRTLGAHCVFVLSAKLGVVCTHPQTHTLCC